jgi:hypothetical protein
MVSLTNYLVDPANIFSSKQYVDGIAVILSLGHNVDNIANYNERLLQEERISNLTKTPDIIILGSSRVMEIGSDFFPGKTVLNCGVSHANIHDLVAVVGLLDSLRQLPPEVFINIDPDLVGAGGTTEWQTLKIYHDYFIRKYIQGNGWANDHYGSNEAHKLSSLISFPYFKKSVDFLFAGGSKKYSDVGVERPRTHGRFSDGTICYPFSYTHPDTAKVSSDAKITGLKQGISEPDSARLFLLNAMIDFLQQKGVKIHFVMLPFHPDFYQAVNTNQPLLWEKYRDLFIRIAGRKNSMIVGNFNALPLKIERKSFYDMYHCSKEAIKTIGITE